MAKPVLRDDSVAGLLLYSTETHYHYDLISNLPPEDNECFICKRDYLTQDEDDVDNPVCIPIKLSCGHIVGKSCFDRWRTKSLRVENCPMCNQKLLPPKLAGQPSRALEYICTSTWFISVEDSLRKMWNPFTRRHIGFFATLGYDIPPELRTLVCVNQVLACFSKRFLPYALMYVEIVELRYWWWSTKDWWMIPFASECRLTLERIRPWLTVKRRGGLDYLLCPIEIAGRFATFKTRHMAFSGENDCTRIYHWHSVRFPFRKMLARPLLPLMRDIFFHDTSPKTCTFTRMILIVLLAISGLTTQMIYFGIIVCWLVESAIFGIVCALAVHKSRRR